MMSQPAPPARTASRRRGRPLLWVAAVLACVVLVSVGVVLYGEYKIHAPQGAGSNPVLFSVVSGDSPTTIANRLQQRGILHNSLLFKIDSRLRGLGGRLYAGTYTLRPNMSIDQMISTLESFRVRLLSITIPPGWRATEIAELLTSHGINGRDFMHAVNHPQYRFGFRIGGPRNRSLQGFLFPDTYLVDPHISGAAFATLMARRFGEIFKPRMRLLAEREHRTIYHIVVMASIIEREDRFVYQKPTIASVYYNRLEAHMPMDSDPTVQFALGHPGDWWPELSIADYHSVQSPYNTYLHMGFPPGPIANPDLSSLEAALHPARTNYFYFSGKGNTGVLLFATTLQQQQENVAKYG